MGPTLAQAEQWEVARAYLLLLAEQYERTGYTEVIAASLRLAVRLADQKAKELKRVASERNRGRLE